MRSLAFVAFAMGTFQVASAITIYDNFDQWDGGYVNWVYGAGQKFPVPNGDNVLKSWRSEFYDMDGWTLTFEIRDENASGYPGDILFSGFGTVPQGGGVVQIDDIDLVLDPDKVYFALWRFPAQWPGASAQITSLGNVPGYVFVDLGGLWLGFASLDLKLTAVFVPEPATMIALGAGLVFLIRKRRK